MFDVLPLQLHQSAKSLLTQKEEKCREYSIAFYHILGCKLTLHIPVLPRLQITTVNLTRMIHFHTGNWNCYAPFVKVISQLHDEIHLQWVKKKLQRFTSIRVSKKEFLSNNLFT